MRGVVAALVTVVVIVAGTAMARTPGSDLSIVLQRQSCMFGCPGYRVAILSDGTVEYEGEYAVGTYGRRAKRISLAAVEALAGELEAAGFASFRDYYGDVRDECPRLAMDQAFASLSFTRGDVTKAVRFYYGCEGVDAVQTLGRLAARVDEVSAVREWVEQTPNDRAALDAVETFLGGCSGVGCDRQIAHLAERTSLLVDWRNLREHGGGTFALCRDGSVYVRDFSLPFVGEIVRQLDSSQQRAITEAIEQVESGGPESDLAAVDWPGDGPPSIWASTAGRFGSLRRRRADGLPASPAPVLRTVIPLLGEGALRGHEHEIRPVVVPLKDTAGWSQRSWPAEDILPARDVGRRVLSPEAWSALRVRWGRTDTSGYEGSYYFDGRAFGMEGPVKLVLAVGAATPRGLCDPAPPWQ